MSKKVKKTPIVDEDKFIFTTDFQKEILRYIIQSSEGILVLPKIKPGYFTLIEHSIIMEGVLGFFKKYKKVPTKPLLIEQLNKVLTSKDYVNLVIQKDITTIKRVVGNLYKEELKEGSIVAENIYKYIAYIEMKNLNSTMDFSNFSLYEDYQNKVAKIIKDSKPTQEDKPLQMVRDTVKRQLSRRANPNVVPTPFRQLNELSNGGSFGYPKGGIFVLLDKPKARKTFTLINVARGYLSMRKTVLYIDTENGRANIMERMVQSTLNRSKIDLLSGESDEVEKRHMRKYKRLGVEFVVERVPAKIANVNDIKNIILKTEAELNTKIKVLVVDYAAKLASIEKIKDDFERIDNVYIELDNLASELELDAIWTAQHVTREGEKHKPTRYEESDIAGAINIVRNAQCIMGLNATEEEEANNIQRLEIVVQRDGARRGRALFNVDLDKQRMREFSKEARMKYDETVGKMVDDEISRDGKGSKKGLKRDRKIDPDKSTKKGGDI